MSPGESKGIALIFLILFENHDFEFKHRFSLSDILTEDQLIVNLSGNGRGIL